MAFAGYGTGTAARTLAFSNKSFCSSTASSELLMRFVSDNGLGIELENVKVWVKDG